MLRCRNWLPAPVSPVSVCLYGPGLLAAATVVPASLMARHAEAAAQRGAAQRPPKAR